MINVDATEISFEAPIILSGDATTIMSSTSAAIVGSQIQTQNLGRLFDIKKEHQLRLCN